MDGLPSRKDKLKLVVFRERPAAGAHAKVIREALNVQAGLRVGRILVMDRQQPMALRADIADLNKNIAGQFALEGQVILRRILRAQRRRKLSEQQNRTIERPIQRLIARWVQEGVGDVWFGR